MNMFKAFENRVAEAFGASRQGITAPFSFRRLAKRATREMEQETYVVDGVNTAPALTTILVSSDDDAVMRPVYPQLSSEVADLVEAEAARKGYVFVGKPLARFMVDPSLRRGRFAVFANNVDALTLEKLRDEERAFLSGFDAFGGAASARSAIATPLEEQEPPAAPADNIPVVEHAVSDDPSAGLNVLPANYVDESLNQVSAPSPISASEPRSLADALPEVVDMDANPIVTPVPEVLGAQMPAVPEVAAAPAEVAVPARASFDTPNTQDSTIGAAPVPVVEKEPASCLLIDRQSGRTYIGTEPETAIGRERTPGGIVLHDPNVSRRHALLSYDGRTWRIKDLSSTNGTLVNDVDIDSCVLRDGDLITLGLLNLEFRES